MPWSPANTIIAGRCTVGCVVRWISPIWQRERLEPAKTAGRLGLGIDDVLQLGAQRLIERCDFGQTGRSVAKKS